MSVEITDNRSGMDALQAELDKLTKGYVAVGLFGDQGSDLIKYAAANEFGATIKHPGGTDYGYRNAKDRKAGKVRFLKKDANFGKATWLGATGEHKIVIPERPFIRGTFDSADGRKAIQLSVDKLTDRVLQRELSAAQAFGALGLVAQGLVQRKIKAGPWEPNAKATIRRKRSSKPLIDTGRMRNSITYRVAGI